MHAESLRSQLEAGLREALPGIVIVDRDLALGARVDADLVALDGDGRLVLVLLLAGWEPLPGTDRVVLATLDALAWARAQRELVARHLGDDRLRSELDPRVVLVAESFAPEVLERLACLGPGAVRLLEVRALRSAGSCSTFLCPVGEVAAGASDDPADFLDGLDEDPRALANLLVSRLERVDEEVECAPDDRGLRFSFHGTPLCHLSAVGGHLRGHLPGGEAPMPFRKEGDLDGFVDAALARYVELVELDAAEDEELAQVELVPHTPRPLIDSAR